MQLLPFYFTLGTLIVPVCLQLKPLKNRKINSVSVLSLTPMLVRVCIPENSSISTFRRDGNIMMWSGGAILKMSSTKSSQRYNKVNFAIAVMWEQP